jgi:predicted nucleic acid-binding protein
MIFLDANVMLEYFFKRRKFEEVKELLHSGEAFCVSIITIHLMYYYVEKEKYSLESFEYFLQGFKVLNSDQNVYNLAKEIRGQNDFEDTLQVATAISNQVQQIVTLDVGLFNRYKKLISIKLL